MPKEGQNVSRHTGCLGISDVGRTSPAVPGRQSAAHFTKPGPFADPCQRHTAMIHDCGQGRHCRLQGQACSAPCRINHAPCGPDRRKSGRRVVAEGANSQGRNRHVRPATREAWHESSCGAATMHDRIQGALGAFGHCWSPCARLRKCSKCMRSLSHCLACTTTILLLDACCNRQMQYSPRGLKSTCETRAKGQALLMQMRILAFPGLCYPTFFSAKGMPQTGCSPEHPQGS